MRHFLRDMPPLYLSFILSLFLALACFLVLSTSLYGATDSFSISTLINEDVEPPSIPGSVVATPVATSQIDISWTASIDNYILLGYRVWRDGVQVGTTTNTFYSDVGLTPSTTYSYYVTAYDFFFNESASSTVVATTTFPVIIAPPSVATTTESLGSQPGTRFLPLDESLVRIQIIPQKNAVLIRYETYNYVRATVQWGRSTSYELGSLGERAFSKMHETIISGLTPGTSYRFSIAGENGIGWFGNMYTGTFTTLSSDDIFPPGNVRNLKAVRDGDDVILTWINPEDIDLKNIRIVRNPNFYPSDIADGWVIYESLGTTARDKEAFKTGERQYYSVFTYDALGNISSGAVVAITKDGQMTPPPFTEENNEIDLKLIDIFFIQEGVRILPGNESIIPIDGAKELTISIPYDRLPEHLKTILVTIAAASDSVETFTFLLRINADKTMYTGTLAPFGFQGIFPIGVTIFDFKTAQIGYTKGTLVAHIDSFEGNVPVEGFILSFLQILNQSYLYWFLGSFLILILVSRKLMRTGS